MALLTGYCRMARLSTFPFIQFDIYIYISQGTMCYLSNHADIDYRRKTLSARGPTSDVRNLTSIDVRFLRLKSISALNE